MAEKPRPSLIDYMAVAISPALIMLLVGSLTFFLLELMYAGEYSDRLRWILFWFVLAMVLISRIAMERGAGAAGMYGMLMAGAVGLAMSRFVEQVYGAWMLLAVIWWCAHRLTWDCTLIDDSQDASGEGLLRVAGIEQQLATSPATSDTISPGKKRSRLMAEVEAKEIAAAAAAQPVVKKKKSRPHANWIERWLSGDNKAARPHTPGLWVVYFSLAALPLFGIGQLRIPATDTVARDYAFRLLMVYVAAAMGLLLTTSFLGLRRYLRQRNMEMSVGIAGNWLTIGSGLLIAILFISLLLPRPAAQYSINGLVDTASEKLVAASEWAFPGGSGGTGPGAEGGETTDAADGRGDEDPNAAAGNQPGGNQNGNAPGDDRGRPGAKGQSGKPGGDQGRGEAGGQDPGQGENGQDQSNQNQSGDNQNGQKNGNQKGSSDGSQKSAAGNSAKGDAGGKTGSAKSSNEQPPTGKEGGKNKSDTPKDGNDRAGKTGKQREAGDDKQAGKQQPDEQKQRQPEQQQQQPEGERQPDEQQQDQKQRNEQQQPNPDGNAQMKRRPPAAQPPAKLTPQSMNNSLPTGLQALFKFLLWMVILAIIVAIAWYCWPGMAVFFQQIWRELQQWWAWLTGQRSRPDEAATAAEEIAAEPPMPFADFANPFAGAGGKWTPGKLTAHTFEALQAWGREQGVERSSDETPIEYAERLRAGLRECPTELMEFVQTYGRVAYARETPQRAQIDGMERLWRFMQRTTDQNLARQATAAVS